MPDVFLQTVGFLLIGGGFAIYIILIWRNFTQKHRQAKELLAAIILGLLSQLSEVFQLNYSSVETTAVAFQMTTESCIIISGTLMGIFWERLTTSKAKNAWSALFLLGTGLDLSMYGFWMGFPQYGSIFQNLSYYTGSAFFVGLLGLFVILALPLYWHMYRYTREFTALILFACTCTMIAGFASGLIAEIYHVLQLNPYLAALFDFLKFSLWYIGQFLFWLILIWKIDYVYRLPFDVHRLLVISRDSGVLAYEASFKTKKFIKIDNVLLSGLFTALNKVFSEVGRKDVALENVAGPGMHFVIEWGEFVATLVVTDQDTYYLRQAMTFFTRDFETRYAPELNAHNPNISIYEKSRDLITKNFPFLIIQE